MLSYARRYTYATRRYAPAPAPLRYDILLLRRRTSQLLMLFHICRLRHAAIIVTRLFAELPPAAMPLFAMLLRCLRDAGYAVAPIMMMLPRYASAMLLILLRHMPLRGALRVTLRYGASI